MGATLKCHRQSQTLQFGTVVLVFALIQGGLSATNARAQTGACCQSNGTCSVFTPLVCGVQGGIFRGMGTSCQASTCIGACCQTNGSCSSNVALATCTSTSGEFQGFGTTCVNQVCGGACCHPDGACSFNSNTGCASPNLFSGLNTSCGSTDCSGACCLHNGSCVEEGQVGCQNDGGSFQGLSAQCNSTDCVGACCQPDGSCVETGIGGCIADLQGEFLGVAATCPGVTCIGACCLQFDAVNKGCLVTTLGDCRQQGGQFRGHSTQCELDCPTTGTTAFTYQGQLKHNGVPMNGQIDAMFSLWLSPTGTSSNDRVNFFPVEIDNINVVDGLFTASLDFLQFSFDGNGRWLEIAIRNHADAPGTFTTLTPRQALTPTPYALETRGIFVSAGGLVGIETKNPVAPLTVHATDKGFVQEDGVNQLATFFNSTIGEIGTFGALNFGLFSNGARAVTIDTSQNVGIGTDTPAVKVHIVNGSDAEPSGGGFIQLGETNAGNLALDNNEIMARNNGATSTLFLNNNGGDTHFGGQLDFGVQKVSTSANADSLTLNCPAGKHILSGGCNCDPESVLASEPTGGNDGWFCICSGTNQLIVIAICANVKY